MAKNKAHIPVTGVTQEDREHADMLLSWARSLDDEITTLEFYEERYWDKKRVNDSP